MFSRILAVIAIALSTSAYADDIDKYVIDRCQFPEACTSTQFESASHGLVHYQYEMIALKLSGEPFEINKQISAVNTILDHHQDDSISRMMDNLRGYDVIRMTIDRPSDVLNHANFNKKTDMIPLNRPNSYYGLKEEMVDDVLSNKVSLVTRDKAHYNDVAPLETSAHTTEQHIDQITPAINDFTPDTHFFPPYNTYTEFNVITGVVLTFNNCADCSSVGYIANEYDFGRKTSPSKKGVESILYGMYQTEGTQYIDDNGYNVLQLPYHRSNKHEYFIIIHRLKKSTLSQAH